MHRFASLTAMVILIVAATASFPPVAAELKILEALSAEEVQAPGIEPPTDSAIEKRLGDFIDGAMAQQFAGNPLVGAVISIVHRGNVVLARAYGHADLEQNISADPEHSLIRPGSISKLFTWVSLLQLAEAGMVDLDADVNRYLEVFKIPKAFDKPVTLRHLMTHSPGFEDEIIEFIVVGSPDDFTSLEVALKNNIPKRLYKPGKVSAYSNYGSALAGYIVERATGVPFDTYIRRNILDPLGMPKATFKEPVPVGAGDHLMKPYYQAGGKFHIAPMEYIHNVAPAGALTTTANELARFMIALLNDGEFEEVDILPGDAGDQMLSRIFGHDPRVPGLAHGIYERWIKGVRALEHKGTTSFYKSDMLLIPQEQFGLFVSYNTPGGAGPRDQLLVAVVNEFFAQDYVPTAEAVPVPLALAETYSGTYRLNQYNATTFEKFLKFGTDIKVNVAESGEATVSSAGKISAYKAQDTDYFRRVDDGDPLVFEPDEDLGTVWMYQGVPIFAAYKLKWYETTAFHRLMLSVGGFVIAMGLLATPWLAGRYRSSSLAHRWSYGILQTALGLEALYAVSFIVIFSGFDVGFLASRIPASLKLVAWLPYLAIMLGALSIVLRLRSQGARSAGALAELIYAASVAAVAAVSWSLYYWNLMGPVFG